MHENLISSLRTACNEESKMTALHADFPDSIAKCKATKPELPDVVSSLNYLSPSVDAPFSYTYEPPSGVPWQNCDAASHAISILDARPKADTLSIDREGFELWRAPTQVINFLNKDEVKSAYYREVEAVLKKATGATEAFVFDHLVRQQETGKLQPMFGQRPKGTSPGAAGMVHSDYTNDSANKRLHLILAEHSVQRRVKRFSIVNLWRSINRPVLNVPLAVCDAQSVAVRDLVPTKIHYPNRVGEIYTALHRSRHQWWYFSEMTREEVLIFKQYDSLDGPVARHTLHTAFENPLAPAGTLPRESIEARCLLIYDE